jgi:hypothetical protein
MGGIMARMVSGAALMHAIVKNNPPAEETPMRLRKEPASDAISEVAGPVVRYAQRTFGSVEASHIE